MRIIGALCMFSALAMAFTPVEPSALLFENEQVKVGRALERPHIKGQFHEHKWNRVMVYLGPGRQRFEYQNGRAPETFDWSAGQVKWNPSGGGMHSPEVLSDAPFNIIEIELKQAGTAKPIASSTVPVQIDPVRIDPKHYQVEFENDQVRVLRVKIGGREMTPLHEHSLNRVTVFLTPQNFRAITADNKTQVVQHKAGDVAWGTPITHREENLSPEPFEAITVELKN